MNFNLNEISHQIIYLLNSHPHPCHIRDKASRYVYMNFAMRELLALPKVFSIEGKGFSEIKLDTAKLFERMNHQEEEVIQTATSVSLLMTEHFGKEKSLQPYIVDIYPFFNETGQLVGTIAEFRQCPFFSPLDYIQGKSPKTSTSSLSNRIFTERELEVIFYFYHTLNSQEVAECLHLSQRTVENKLGGIYEKMGVHHQKGFRKYIQDKGLHEFIPYHLLASHVQNTNILRLTSHCTVR